MVDLSTLECSVDESTRAKAVPLDDKCVYPNLTPLYRWVVEKRTSSGWHELWYMCDHYILYHSRAQGKPSWVLYRCQNNPAYKPPKLIEPVHRWSEEPNVYEDVKPHIVRAIRERPYTESTVWDTVWDDDDELYGTLFYGYSGYRPTPKPAVPVCPVARPGGIS